MGKQMQILERQNPYLVLVASLVVALGAWGANVEMWAQLAEPSMVFGLIGTVGGILIAWTGRSPFKPQK